MKRLRWVLSSLCLFLLILTSAVSLATAADFPKRTPIYQVYALHYGTMEGYDRSYLFNLGTPGEKMTLDWSFWVIVGNGRVVLVDTGFSDERFVSKWGIKDWTRTDKLLPKIGLKPSQVTDIILTHAHWDHAGNIENFNPKATIWIQKDELEFAAGEAAQSNFGKIGLNREDVLDLVNWNWDGRVKLIRGDKEIIPGIKCYLGGKHTYGFQWVSVNTASGTVVLASDIVYMFENLETMTPIGTGQSSYEAYQALERIREVASSLDLIVPGHDPKVYQKWPSPGNGVAEIR
jgi:glyoxylase-like metal-dependent hydrolase (beta-lactamase superfamily II)